MMYSPRKGMEKRMDGRYKHKSFVDSFHIRETQRTAKIIDSVPQSSKLAQGTGASPPPSGIDLINSRARVGLRHGKARELHLRNMYMYNWI
jgi:hypothetical protein